MDLVPLEDEWNERRRIHMTSVVGGFKGMCTHVCDLVQWRVNNVTE